MAAWSDHDDRSWADFQTKRLAEVVDEVVDSARQRYFCPTCEEWTAETTHCGNAVTRGPGGVFVSTNRPQDLKEPFPSDAFELFSDSDLDQLVVDACKEMGRRELERKNLAECGIYVNPNQS